LKRLPIDLTRVALESHLLLGFFQVDLRFVPVLLQKM
jgi:hypothetical protein